jgi:hypothetical protein
MIIVKGLEGNSQQTKSHQNREQQKSLSLSANTQ